MNYTYNIKINLKKDLINFYEWENNDNIITIKKIPVFTVSENDYSNIINKNIKVFDNFLNKISFSNYVCIFCTAVDAIVIEFNKKGFVNKLSKLTLEEESEVIDEFLNNKKYELKYEITETERNYSFNTREENYVKKQIYDFLVKEKLNDKTIEYLYFEWFGNTIGNKKYEMLTEAVLNDYSDNHEKLHKIIELIEYENV